MFVFQAICDGYQKPISLLYHQICQHMAVKGGWILDAGCGSGSASVAALHAGMNVLAYDHCDITADGARARLETWSDHPNMASEQKSKKFMDAVAALATLGERNYIKNVILVLVTQVTKP